jgi:hypothetical protein
LLIKHIFIYSPNNRDLVKDGMLLYRHSARCPIAMQWFLDGNPHFWPFVPMTHEQAKIGNENYVVPTTVPMDPTSPFVTKSDTRSDLDAGLFLTDLPPLPSDKYTFSTRQCVEQFQMFKNQRNRLLVNPHLDLYNATIIAVRKCFSIKKNILSLCRLVPNNSSGPLQRLVEALFITHAETKLNTIGHLDRCVTNNNNLNPSGMTRERIIADRGNWCHNLI